MNKIDIQPKFVKGLACYEGSLLAIAAARKLEYQIALSHTFGFAYTHKKNATIGDGIKVSDSDFIGRVKKYCGLEMFSIPCNENIDGVVKKLIENGNVVGVESNAYYCPWSYEYLKNDRWHHYLVVDFNDKGYRCIDTTMYENFYDIDYDTFTKGFKNLNCFKINTLKEKAHYESILEESILSIINSSCLEDLELFLVDFKDIIYEKEFSSMANSYWGCALQRNIGFYLVGTTELYSDFISFISTKIPNINLSILGESINDIRDNWSILHNIILKIYYTGDDFIYGAKANDCLKSIVEKYHYVIEKVINNII